MFGVGAAAGSRPRGQEPLGPRSTGLRQAFQQRRTQLALFDDSEPGTGEPAHPPAARQGAGRIKRDQRDGLYPW